MHSVASQELLLKMKTKNCHSKQSKVMFMSWKIDKESSSSMTLRRNKLNLKKQQRNKPLRI